MDRNKLTQAQTEASEGLVCAHLAELGLEPSDAGKAAWPPFTEAPAVIETKPEPVFPHEPDPEAVADAARRGDGTGFCVACGHMQRDIGPRDRSLHCEVCGAHKVCGAEELMIMGYGPETDT